MVKIVFVTLLILIVVFVGIVCLIIFLHSPGKLSALRDEDGNIPDSAVTEKEFIMINAVRQGFFIRSENRNNPVLLFLHGGPGSPELPLIEAKEEGERLEKYFTVCYWDQRGAGMSYSGDMPASSMTVLQYVEDTRVMTEYLLKRFGRKKIYLMGHSWGTYVGVKTIEKYPEYYKAYMAIAQVTDQRLSEKLAYEYMLNYAREIGDKKGEKALLRFDVQTTDFPSLSYLGQVRSRYMNKYGVGITHQFYSTFDVVRDVMLFKGYTFSEKIGYLKGSLFSITNVFPAILEDSLFESSLLFDVPVYVFHGVHDYQVSYVLSRDWVDRIHAPAKGFYSFEHSAHSPNMEEENRFVSIIRKLLEERKNS